VSALERHRSKILFVQRQEGAESRDAILDEHRDDALEPALEQRVMEVCTHVLVGICRGADIRPGIPSGDSPRGT